VTKAHWQAAAATCLLLLSSCSHGETCSHAEKPAGDDQADGIENLEMQSDKLAAGTGASCPEDFSALETGRTLRISMFYGYDNSEGKVYDRVNARSMSHALTSQCRGRLSTCGFAIVSSSPSAVRLLKTLRTLDGRKVEINLFTSSLTDDAKEGMNPDVMYLAQDKLSRSMKQRFYRELVESDIVFYMGHSRLGGGMDFDVQPGVTTLFNAVFRLPMHPILRALRQRPTRLKMMGLFSCYSNQYFRRDLQDANPSLALILTTGYFNALPAEQASLGALDAVLSKKCARAFHESMIPVREPDPGMTSLIRGQ
jgi:hypothetical protein